MTSIFYNCSLCKYKSSKKFNLNRHMVAKHNNENCNNVITNCKNVINNCKNVIIDNKCNKISTKKIINKLLEFLDYGYCNDDDIKNKINKE